MIFQNNFQRRKLKELETGRTTIGTFDACNKLVIKITDLLQVVDLETFQFSSTQLLHGKNAVVSHNSVNLNFESFKI